MRERLGIVACSLALGLLVWAVAPRGVAEDEVTVPVELQIELLGRVARYERTYAARGSEVAPVLVVVRPRHAASARIAAQLSALLARAGEIGGRAILVASHDYAGAGPLAARVAAEHREIVYLTPGLGEEVLAIATELEGQSVLTVSAVPGDVDRGVVLGFELVSSRPRIAINVVRARAQQLSFNAHLMRLARVVQ